MYISPPSDSISLTIPMAPHQIRCVAEYFVRDALIAQTKVLTVWPLQNCIILHASCE